MNVREQLLHGIGFVNDSLTLTSRAQEKAGMTRKNTPALNRNGRAPATADGK
jgi:hypothetical protein